MASLDSLLLDTENRQDTCKYILASKILNCLLSRAWIGDPQKQQTTQTRQQKTITTSWPKKSLGHLVFVAGKAHWFKLAISLLICLSCSRCSDTEILKLIVCLALVVYFVCCWLLALRLLFHSFFFSSIHLFAYIWLCLVFTSIYPIARLLFCNTFIWRSVIFSCSPTLMCPSGFVADLKHLTRCFVRPDWFPKPSNVYGRFRKKHLFIYSKHKWGSLSQLNTVPGIKSLLLT